MNRLKIKLIKSGALCGVFFLIACGGTSGQLKLSGVDKPLSFSPFMRGAGGPISEGNGLTNVGHVSYLSTHWTVFYSLIDLTDPDSEITEFLTNEISTFNGDGAVNLSISVTSNFISQTPVLCWLPIWPSSSTIKVEADIVSKDRQ